jgi:selenocysteine lyase/cysteine desulfurase
MQNHTTQHDEKDATTTITTAPQHWSRNRRDFLRILGSGALAATLGTIAGCSQGNASSPVDELRRQLLFDERFWADVKAMFPLNPAKRFMNIGTAGAMPTVALDLFDQENRARAAESLSGYGNLLAERTEVAPGFGVDPDELAFSSNTSSGMCHAILGIQWSPGDVVVTTNHEHPGGDVPLAIAAARYGIEISRVALPVGNNQTAQTYVTLFDDRIRALRTQGRRVRAMMFSAPTYKTGTMLPIAELMEVAKRHELISIVDGAHLPGMMAYHYGDLGMDFMSGAGHKWQCGPGSTGILIVRNKIRASNPLPLPDWYPIHTSSWTPQPRTTTGTATYNIGSVITACGSLHTPMYHSLVSSCKLWDEIGRKKIETHDLTLSAYLKERIAEVWGVDRLYSPKDDPKLVSALTSFNPFMTAGDVLNSTKSGQFVARMLSDYSPAFVIRNVNVPVVGAPSDHYAIRISTHLWTCVDDIDKLVAAMYDLSRKMG